MGGDVAGLLKEGVVFLVDYSIIPILVLMCLYVIRSGQFS